MDKNQLIESARTLKQPRPDVVDKLVEVQDKVISMVNKSLENRSDTGYLVSENYNMMRDNHTNHLKFMISIFRNYVPEVLVETVIWVLKAYHSHGFQMSYWPVQLNTWIEVYRKELPEEYFNEIVPYYDWLLLNHSWFAKISRSEKSG